MENVWALPAASLGHGFSESQYRFHAEEQGSGGCGLPRRVWEPVAVFLF